MEKLFIPVLQGTTRQKRKSIYAAWLVERVGKEFEEVKTVLVDPLDFNFPFDGNDPEGKDPRYSKITKEADGFFIVTPEYNHGYPGSLKRMLDSELENYIHKPVAFAGVSSGPWGKGNLLDEKYRERVKRPWEELIWMAKVLKSGRTNVKSKYHTT
ncbi:NAD(P)H-dependent oxidoreductase [Candidatus Roizmanbacteria bacterium]|nr:NAD(P)H-dependent oxidoreductase [Candidatus Roizmanbacteria bacterium]